MIKVERLEKRNSCKLLTISHSHLLRKKLKNFSRTAIAQQENIISQIAIVVRSFEGIPCEIDLLIGSYEGRAVNLGKVWVPNAYCRKIIFDLLNNIIDLIIHFQDRFPDCSSFLFRIRQNIVGGTVKPSNRVKK